MVSLEEILLSLPVLLAEESSDDLVTFGVLMEVP